MSILAAFAICASALWGQSQTPVPMRDVTQRPSTIKKPEPRYSKAAEEAGISGEVWLEIVIDTNGRPTDIAIVSPLGWGLDEEAVAAISRWTFKPGMKNGTPVPVLATVAVSFHLLPGSIDKNEKMRGRYNNAIRGLQTDQPGRRKSALETLQRLAKDGFPPAMFTYGVFLREGKEVPADVEAAMELFRKAAKKDYGPALYEVGRMHARGVGMPLDPEKARETIFLAANRGSDSAQYFLGISHQMGADGYERNEETARQFFRLCAAAGRKECQLQLARNLLNRPGRRETDFLQAIAWLELASAQDSPAAEELLSAYRRQLTERQRDDVEGFRAKLVRKN